MSKDNFEAWCTPVDSLGPVDLPDKLADHTFVYCSNKKKSFKCWGGAERDNPQAALVAKGKGGAAYCKASKYRGVKDSANLGVYGVNGVCHQSTNLFLYSVQNTHLPLDKDRPKGVVASHLLYGVYGSAGPGNTGSEASFFATWCTAVYAQAKVRCLFSFTDKEELTPDEPDSLPNKIYDLHLNNSLMLNDSKKKNSIELLVDETGIIINHYLPGMKANPISQLQSECLGEKYNVLCKYGLSSDDIQKRSTALTLNDINGMTNSLNKLSISMQDEMMNSIGRENYKQLAGDIELYAPINPLIAAEVLGDINVLKTSFVISINDENTE